MTDTHADNTTVDERPPPKRKAPAGTVLYEAPGPRTLARYRLYNLVAIVLVLGVVGLFLWQMQRTGEFAYEKWEFVVTPSYIEVIFLEGVWPTVRAAVIAILAALALGLVFGVGKLSDSAFIRWPAWLWVEFFRAVPLLLLILYIYFAYGVGDGIGPYWSLVLGLALYNGAVLAEIVRAGIQALPAGQSEAAYAIGMTKGQVTRLVQLPQAIKIMLPAMISQFVVCLKDTSLGYAIGALSLTYIMGQIALDPGAGRPVVQAAFVMAALYIVLNQIVTWIAEWAQRRYVGEGKVGAQDAGTGEAG
jgi:glutamate transport system permease protein